MEARWLRCLGAESEALGVGVAPGPSTPHPATSARPFSALFERTRREGMRQGRGLLY